MIRYAALLALATLAVAVHAGEADGASPLVQFISGVPPGEIECRDGLVLALRGSDSSPVCLTPQTLTVLSERGWILTEPPDADVLSPGGTMNAPLGIPADLAEASNDCAARYYSQLSPERHGRNTVYSPIGAYLGFSVMYEGAGYLAKSIDPDFVHDNICIEPDDAKRRKGVAHMAEYLGYDRDDSFMRMPSLLWAAASRMPDDGHLYFPKKSVLDILHEFYPVDTYVDRYSDTKIYGGVPSLQPGIPSGSYAGTFAYPDLNTPLIEERYAWDPSRRLAAQNAWLQRVTDDGMSEVPSWESILTARTHDRLLFNVAYFEGQWKQPFAGMSYAPRFWYHGSGISPDWMTARGTFGYAALENYSMVSIPFRDGFSMMVVLPREPGGLGEIQEGLAADTVAQWRQELAPHDVEIKMPKFEMRMQYSLENVMHNLADFNRFTFRVDGFPDSMSYQPIRISDIVYSSQEAHILVDERGANVMHMNLQHVASAGMPDADVRFTADHPFLFLILDDASGAILMMGSVYDPTSSDWEEFYQGPTYSLGNGTWYGPSLR